MLSLIVLLCVGQFDDLDSKRSEAPAASASETSRVHDLLSGLWEIVSLDDNGEKIGPELIRRRFALDGKIVIRNRRISIVNPETSASREIAYRINTATNPRSIDVITTDDQLLRGIFRFDNDDLLVCIAHRESSPRPDSFEAPSGSERLFVRLRLPSGSKPGASSGVDAEPSFDAIPSSRVTPVSRVDEVASATPPARRATESEIRNAHERLAGDWIVRAMVDNGQNIGTELIKTRFAEDGHVRIGSNFVSYVNPTREEKRVSVYQVDPAASPSRIDLTTQVDTVLKGIYKFDGDDLVLCLAKYPDVDRPSGFEAAAGSDHMLIRMQLAPKETVPVAPPAPTPAELSAEREATIRDMIVGSWNYVDRKGSVTIVFRPDGSFVATRTWARGMKKLFDGTTTSEGRWAYAHGALTGNINRSQDRKMLGHAVSARVQSIGDASMVFTDGFGELQKARKLN